MPESLNSIFGQNLKALCIEAGTFSDAARNLDISRVQLMRFIRGESFPKPNQLNRICAHFQTDARIFLQPLADLRKEMRDDKVSGPEPCLPESLKRYAEPAIPLTDGIHMIYRPSFTFPDLFISAPLMVRRRKGVTWLKGLDVPVFGSTRRDSGLIRDRSYAGFALSSPDGFVMYFHGTGTVPFLSAAHFNSSGYFAATGYFRGVYEIHRAAQIGEKRRVPIILAPLRQKASVIMDRVRRAGLHSFDVLPDHVRPYLLQGATD